MRLEELLHDIEVSRSCGDLGVEITHLAYDSRLVGEGGLFFAVPGRRQDGRSFIADAEKRGAVAVVSSPDPGGQGPTTKAYVEVPEIRRVMARMACRFYGEPSLGLNVIGITGTNGKTTCTYLLESILREAGFTPGVIGTIGYRYRDRQVTAKVTTPESVDLQRLLAEMSAAGVTHVLVEVSSHGIDLHRVYGCHFACCVFTNLTRDHLDYHVTMEQYFEAKARLFTELLPSFDKKSPVAVINVEDPYGRRLKQACPVPVLSFHAKGPADYRIERLSATSLGLSLTVATPDGRLELASPLLTEVNALNILAAVAAAGALGIPGSAIVEGVRRVEPVPGRLEKVWDEGGITVVVDYAHTPDALERVLASLRTLVRGRLITVFGCGGDRDKGKRPLMGTASARLSDIVIVTSDNPRSEPPAKIIEEIVQGIDACQIPFKKPVQLAAAAPAASGKAYTCEVDRREAIRLALTMARAGDLVLIAGKGHETVQIIGEVAHPFSDQEEVRDAMRSIRAGGNACVN